MTVLVLSKIYNPKDILRRQKVMHFKVCTDYGFDIIRFHMIAIIVGRVIGMVAIFQNDLQNPVALLGPL